MAEDTIRAYDPRKGDLAFDRPPGNYEPPRDPLDFLMKVLTALQMGQAPAGIATMPGGPGGAGGIEGSGLPFSPAGWLKGRFRREGAAPWTGPGTGGYEALPETQLNQAFKNYMGDLNSNVGGFNLPKPPGVQIERSVPGSGGPEIVTGYSYPENPKLTLPGEFISRQGGDVPRYSPYPVERAHGKSLVVPDTELSEQWWNTLAAKDMKNAPQGQGYIPPRTYGQLHEEYPGISAPGTIFQGYEVLKDILRTAVKQFTPQGQTPPRKPPGF